MALQSLFSECVRRKPRPLFVRDFYGTDMTRITSLRMKRPYNDAQFNTIFESREPAAIAETGGSTLNENEEGRARKRRKRSGDDTDGFQTNAPVGNGVVKGTKLGKKRFAGEFSRAKMDAFHNSGASESRRQRRIRERQANTTCFACREKGHAANNCPKSVSKGTQGQEKAVGICYRCGSTKHSLSRCLKPEDPENPLPFAICFVCSQKGHLVSKCPQNNGKGVYPNGGCCKLCSQTTHLAKDCPLRHQGVNAHNALFSGSAGPVGADEDDFHALQRRKEDVIREEQHEEKLAKVGSLHVRKNPRVVQF